MLRSIGTPLVEPLAPVRGEIQIRALRCDGC
jgi:hypothetical protein